MSFDENTGLVLGSVLYFWGRWLHRADIRSTAAQKFCLDGTCVDVSFGEYDRARLFCAAHEGFKVIKLPYQQTEVPYRADCPLSNKFVAPPR